MASSSATFIPYAKDATTYKMSILIHEMKPDPAGFGNYK